MKIKAGILVTGVLVLWCSFAVASGRRPVSNNSLSSPGAEDAVVDEEPGSEEELMPAEQAWSVDEPDNESAGGPAVEVKGLPGVPGIQNSRIHKVWLWQETRDCLWTLAEKYYGDPWKWKLIYLANQDKIDNPSKIYPKQELIIPEE
jgi:nucleoid-associated protein YgaU